MPWCCSPLHLSDLQQNRSEAQPLSVHTVCTLETSTDRGFQLSAEKEQSRDLIANWVPRHEQQEEHQVPSIPNPQLTLHAKLIFCLPKSRLRE